jgi:hypothetical protein
MSTVDRRGAPDPAGTVAVVFSSEVSRYSRMFATLNDLDTPDGSIKTFWWGARCQALNDAVAAALKTNSYWVWFISEDYGFDRTLLTSLISRNVPMVSPIVIEGYAPFLPTAWTDVGTDGTTTPLLLDQVTGPSSLIEVRGASVTGMLVRRAVFEAMGAPWFRVTETVSEDLFFCEHARELGFQPFIDTESRLSTLSVASITPRHKGDRWELGVDVGEDMHFTQPLKHR